ncbi:MAG: hypothetical protein ACYDD1_20115 [Caulobacteraceae bacterium]
MIPVAETRPAKAVPANMKLRFEMLVMERFSICGVDAGMLGQPWSGKKAPGLRRVKVRSSIRAQACGTREAALALRSWGRRAPDQVIASGPHHQLT